MTSIDTELSGAIERAALAATRAPSPHNTQPWRFELGRRHVDVLLDRDRLLPVADQDNREAMLACGAAMLDLRLALNYAGFVVHEEFLVGSDRPDLLGRIVVGGPRQPSPHQRALHEAIARRATDRGPLLDRVVPDQLRAELVAAAEYERAELVQLDRIQALDSFASLLRQADHLQEGDPAFQAELRRWVTHRPDRADGVPAWAGAPRPIGGETLPEQAGPMVAVVATGVDTRADRLLAGHAMQRVLLTATVLGLSTSFLSQPIEVPYTRAALRELIGGHLHPQTVLRIGYGAPVPPTPRLPVDAVTTH